MGFCRIWKLHGQSHRGSRQRHLVWRLMCGRDGPSRHGRPHKNLPRAYVCDSGRCGRQHLGRFGHSWHGFSNDSSRRREYAYLWQINSGADGNLWVTVRDQATIVRVTTAGDVRCITISRQGSDFVTAGPDGNTWFTEQEAPSLLGRITPSGTLTEFSDPNFCGSLVGAGDGYLYCGSPHGIVRISTADASETVVAPQRDEVWGFSASGRGSNAKLYFSRPDTHLVTLHLSNYKFDIDTIPANEKRPRFVAFGADGNLWYSAGGPASIEGVGTDIFRVITVSPTSMTLRVGQTQTATASQTENPNSVFAASSENPAIASVASGQTAGTFNVTGQSSGSTAVRIADKMNNYVDIAVTVH